MTQSPPINSARTIRIGIVEDDSVLGAELVENLSRVTDFLIVGWAETLHGGLDFLSQELDVLLVDLGLPDGSGLDLIALGSQKPGMKILVMSVFGDVQNVVRAIEQGADGYLLKGAEPLEAKAAIRTVLSGGAPISPGVAGHILARLRVQPAAIESAEASLSLTPREVGILEHLAKGLSYRKVAEVEGISHHTVGDHVKSIYKKLAVNSRSEAVFEAAQAGLIRLHDR